MEAAAIKRIEELVASSQTIDPRMDVVAVLPGDAKLASLEPFMEIPLRMRQSFSTARIPDFVAYVKGSETDTTAVYVAPDGSTAKAIIDHGTQSEPDWGSHTAVLNLEKTRAYAALETLCAKSRSQQDLIDYLEDWAKDGVVECLVNGNTVAASLAIAAVRKVEIKASASATHEQGDFNVSRSAIEEMDVRGATEKMPTHIVLMSPIYFGTEFRDIYCRIGITGDEGKPQFRLRIMKLESIQEEVAKEVETTLHAQLAGLRVFVGSVSR